MLSIYEIWLPVAGFEGFYEVSNFGRLRNSRTGLIRAQRPDADGYMITDLKVDGVQTTVKIHRELLKAFEPRDDASEMEVDHWNGVRSHNVWGNLRWATVAVNRRNIHATKGASKIRCVRFREGKANPWQAYARIEGRFKSIGHFISSQIAIQARDRFEEANFGSL